MRRLAIVILVAALAAPAARASAQDASQSSGTSTAPVDVFKVTGLIDPVLANGIDRAIDRAARNGSQALVLQMNSKGAVVSRARMERLARHIATAPIPVAIWVGPSGARATGMAGQLLGAAAATGMAGRTRVGNFGELLAPEGVAMQLGAAGDELKSRTVGAVDARQLGLVRVQSKDPTIEIVKNMIAGLDGLLAMRLGKLEKVKYTSIKPPHAWSGTPAETDFDLPSIKTPTVIFRGSPADAGRLYPKNANLAVTVALCGAGLDRTEIELVADPTLPEGCNASKLEVVSDSGELNMYRLGRAMPDNPKTGVLTALTMADDLMKIVRASDW